MNLVAELEIYAISTGKSVITRAFIDEVLGESAELIEKSNLAKNLIQTYKSLLMKNIKHTWKIMVHASTN
ncbi:hypothetical protein FKY96_03690 [Enterococcus faecalis]|uniref:Uncharacterized protein n=1 Tax=Enterococcus faecalis TaxID=1351 RepID=A0A4V5UQ30_ENTFL|nr:hypothetical protein [Enterococcus faecalis]EIT2193404.1 hypothetical protein [Enterococcus faecalis]EIY5963178.1 hypothetical protein [Enterococcus faecalis]EKZ0175329.1 hypothetical protein [Enterococcus faecalis]MBP4070977.1 hypothetical protein [Enterococcus faecalis]MBP4099004.1 hypothetical protein [Enterococcus faecalis]